MLWINSYFKSFTWLKTAIFVFLVLMGALTLEWQIERLYWQYWPFNPLEIKSFEIFHPELIRNPGDVLQYTITYDKLDDKVPIIHRELLNTRRYFYTDVPAKVKEVGYDRSSTDSLTIPRDGDPGEYKIYWQACYYYGPDKKREVCVGKISGPFYVALEQGVKGPKGDTGKQGPQGAKGDRGKNFWGK
jgi:hypothetical protein